MKVVLDTNVLVSARIGKVSGDPDLLILQEYQATMIISPSAFIEILNRQEGPTEQL